MPLLKPINVTLMDVTFLATVLATSLVIAVYMSLYWPNMTASGARTALESNFGVRYLLAFIVAFLELFVYGSLKTSVRIVVLSLLPITIGVTLVLIG